MSSSKDIHLFNRETLTFTDKFYLLMDLLVSNQGSSYIEAFLFLGIYYLQTITGFFSPLLSVFDITNSKSDKIIYYLLKLTRIRDLFFSSYSTYKVFIYLFAIYLLFTALLFLILIIQTKRQPLYSCTHSTLNYLIKTYLNILFNIILDFTISSFCFGGNNPHFEKVTCSYSDKIAITVIAAFVFIVNIVCNFFIIIYYSDSFYLSNSPYSKMACGYSTIMSINNVLYSVILNESKYLTKEIFFIYNTVMSISLLKFYLTRCVYYAKASHALCGIFHVLYVWTSLFFFIFAYIDFQEKSLVYLVSSAIVLYFYFHLQYKIEEKLLLTIPFYKIENKYFLLYYIKSILDKINIMDKDAEEKAILTGILQMHSVECPNEDCLTKTRNKIYLPIANEWSDRSKPLINDRVFLMNFIVVIMNYFLHQNFYSPELIINEALYFLEILGNYCLAMFYYKKVKEMKLNSQNNFSYVRLKHAISKALVANLKPPNEPCLHLEDLDVTLFFKYIDLSQKLYDEMNNDVTFSLEFWKSFRNSQHDSSHSNHRHSYYQHNDNSSHMNGYKVLDFNKIFRLTDKIRITKLKVEELWRKLYNIYNGVNDLFELYLNYTEQINDDDLLKRDLDEIKRKSENSAEFIQQNFYSVLFNKETAILICNGDKGSEGIIEKTNNEVEQIFKYKPEELRGMNVNQLMPRLFAKEHQKFMANYFEVGEKKVIDNKDMKSFGKDKDNSLMLLKICVKVFPILNENVFFVSMIVKENIDDVIFIDGKFVIQGMSAKLMNVLQIENNRLFMEHNIPFYLICKQFVNFYKIFLHNKHNNHYKSKKKKVNNGDNNDENNINNNQNSEDEKYNEGNINGTAIPKEFTIRENEEKDSDEEEDEFRSTKQKRNDNITTNGDISEEYNNNDNGRLDINNSDVNNNNINTNLNNSYDSNENVEINENIELEYEIRIPQFIYDYANGTIRKNNHHRNNAFGIGGNYSTNKIQTFDTEFSADLNYADQINNTIDEFGESDYLVEEDDSILMKEPTISKHPSRLSANANITPGNLVTPTPGNTNIGNASINDFNKQSEEEKDFFSNLQRSQDLFEKAKFQELEDFIDNVTQNTLINEYRFNFTFDKYKYGSKQHAYVVRCIDNKNDPGRSEEETLGEEGDPKLFKCRKDKNQSLQLQYELLEEEKEDLLNQHERFLQISLENKQFQMMLNKSKDEIFQFSMIHGRKKEEINIDENSSQSSQTGYNADLCRKNHIEEVRANIMKNVSNFYTLKYIKLMGVMLLVCSCIFISIFIVYLHITYDDMLVVSNLNINLFHTALWTSNLLGSVISLTTLIQLYCDKENNDNENNDEILYATYLDNKEDYFDILKDYSEMWYNQIVTHFGFLEYNIGSYIDDPNLFWSLQTVTYNFPDLTDRESYPLGLSQILTDMNSLLQSELFSLDCSHIQNANEQEIEYMRYSEFLSIGNCFDNLLPSQFTKLTFIPNKLQDYNSGRISYFLYTIIIYFILVFIINFAYGLLLFITNKNMGEGLEKVTKIRIDKVEDTIKRIEGFYDILKKHRDKESKNSYKKDQMQYAKEQSIDKGNGIDRTTLPQDAAKTNVITLGESTYDRANSKHSRSGNNNILTNTVVSSLNHHLNINANNSSSHSSNSDINAGGFNAEIKEHKQLRILSYAYSQIILIVIILCAFLIPLLILSMDMIDSTNKMIDIQNYLFGKLLTSSISVVDIKCEMSKCSTSPQLEFQFQNNSHIQSIIQAINIFPKLDSYYNEKFLVNACASAFDQNDNKTQYDLCLNDSIIISANNTDSLLKLISEKILTLNEESKLQFEINSDFNIMELYKEKAFVEMENIFYNYITPVSYNMEDVMVESLEDFLFIKFWVLILLCGCLVLCMIIMAIWIGLCVVNQLIHLLSVSRCILKIIPTIVIYNTPELESWIENKY